MNKHNAAVWRMCVLSGSASYDGNENLAGLFLRNESNCKGIHACICTLYLFLKTCRTELRKAYHNDAPDGLWL